MLLLFSDITGELRLRAQYNSLVQVQQATLDKLNDAGCTLLVTVVADAATLRPYCVMPERPLAVRYVFVSRENVPAAVIFTNGVPEAHEG